VANSSVVKVPSTTMPTVDAAAADANAVFVMTRST
jgi:hypothetical protein